MNREKERQIRSLTADLKTRNKDDGEKVIEGYFAVFNSETELWPGAYEEINSSAFNKTLGNDIRALMNHDSAFVLGRTKAGTLQLKVDERGLWGSIKINENDSDAVNLYERVKRGDVDQCSFGFNIPVGGETAEQRDDGSIKWTLREVDLHEVSVVTFPAYSDTGVQARKRDVETMKKQKLEQRKKALKEKMKIG
ncbi:HK97 family phage prohead protease [Sporosarcina sp. F6_3S_P_2]|uniref:HK97 family phage prohead protease n=1 Tax=Sporosarcina highlanderae TaxID=3035916 RepID=A0ABT8JVD0_9BACL|nr:HK97 family phage prohead protease [Sporosarcina highlanderae]MDN4609129.1 HK97 family phage prohead protease [Sporosarcina highlanderae]